MNEILKSADAILVTASNGFSINEGINIFRFNQEEINTFAKFVNKYHINSLLSGMFCYMDKEDKWEFIKLCYQKYHLKYSTSTQMDYLLEILENKDYFVVTSNTESHFEKVLDPSNIYNIEGSMKELICTNPKCMHIYETKDYLNSLTAPLCKECQSILKLNVCDNGIFKENLQQRINFNSFLTKHQNDNLVVLELGIGSRNTLIKKPIMDYISIHKNIYYITINLNDIYVKEDIKDRTLIINDTIENGLKNLL